jgi:diadenosine tetraphosphate (Ap4A) HIT family hydrolase
VSLGHALIIPKRHVANYFDLTNREREAMNVMLQYVKCKIDKRFNPDGYNIGINDGVVSGQTIKHTHIHLIPRYNNDGGLPCGVRNVFPPHLADYRKYF